jgi:hypothetical protein
MNGFSEEGNEISDKRYSSKLLDRLRKCEIVNWLTL